jgi:hypothetical protein
VCAALRAVPLQFQRRAFSIRFARLSMSLDMGSDVERASLKGMAWGWCESADSPTPPKRPESPCLWFDIMIDLQAASVGVTSIGIVPSLFEGGDPVRAETVERMVGARQGTAWVLCPYRAKRVARLAGAASLVRSHSHTITALGPNRFLLEQVESRPRS